MESARADVLRSRCQAPHHFEIAKTGQGLWRVEDREGLIGGIFRTRKDAMRFAMSEADGDRARVRLRRTDNALRPGVEHASQG